MVWPCLVGWYRNSFRSTLFSCLSPSAVPSLATSALGFPHLQSSSCVPRWAWTPICTSQYCTTIYGGVSTLGETSPESEQPLFFTDIQTQDRSLTGLGTTGCLQPSGSILWQSKDVTLSCLERATGSMKTFPQINLGCSNTTSLPGVRSRVLPFEFH